MEESRAGSGEKLGDFSMGGHLTGVISTLGLKMIWLERIEDDYKQRKR